MKLQPVGNTSYKKVVSSALADESKVKDEAVAEDSVRLSDEGQRDTRTAMDKFVDGLSYATRRTAAGLLDVASADPALSSKLLVERLQGLVFTYGVDKFDSKEGFGNAKKPGQVGHSSFNDSYRESLGLIVSRGVVAAVDTSIAIKALKSPVSSKVEKGLQTTKAILSLAGAVGAVGPVFSSAFPAPIAKTLLTIGFASDWVGGTVRGLTYGQDKLKSLREGFRRRDPEQQVKSEAVTQAEKKADVSPQ